jgi:hypothetical protein
MMMIMMMPVATTMLRTAKATTTTTTKKRAIMFRKDGTYRSNPDIYKHQFMVWMTSQTTKRCRGIVSCVLPVKRHHTLSMQYKANTGMLISTEFVFSVLPGQRITKSWSV